MATRSNTQEEAEMVELHNGCICCTLRGDLLNSVKRLNEQDIYDYFVVETTGISTPLPIAQTFTMGGKDLKQEDENGEVDISESEVKENERKEEGKQSKYDSLFTYARLDTMVTVVYAVNMFDVLQSMKFLADKNNKAGMIESSTTEGAPEHERSIVQLFLDQVEYAK